MVDVRVFDDIIPRRQRIEVWDYIQNQEWHVYWKPTRPFPGMDYDFVPAVDKDWLHINPVYTAPNLIMPRALFASDAFSLEKNHPVIWNLWQNISKALNDEYVIEGPPEGMRTDELADSNPKWLAPPTKVPDIPQGWRVYANCQPDETIKRTHGIHRDEIDVESTTSFTLLYYANLEWYPSWFGENVYYPDDPRRLVGDSQQFQGASKANQSRNFPIGWLDNGGKTVSPVPGRVVLYDGRTLHTTRPASYWAKEARKNIVFRLKKKT